MATYEFSSDSIKNMLGRFAKAADGAVKGAREALREDAERERVNERIRKEEERAALAWQRKEGAEATQPACAQRTAESAPVVSVPAHVETKPVGAKPMEVKPAAHAATTASDQPARWVQHALPRPAPSPTQTFCFCSYSPSGDTHEIHSPARAPERSCAAGLR